MSEGIWPHTAADNSADILCVDRDATSLDTAATHESRDDPPGTVPLHGPSRRPQRFAENGAVCLTFTRFQIRMRVWSARLRPPMTHVASGVQTPRTTLSGCPPPPSLPPVHSRAAYSASTRTCPDTRGEKINSAE